MNLVNKVLRLRTNFNKRGGLFFSRKKAHRLRKRITNARGHSHLNYHTKKRIKLYAKETFGSSAFWPWLALYTEIRGEFIDGWLPDDFYTVYLLKSRNNYIPGYISDFKTLDYKLFPDIAIKPLFILARGNIYNSKGEKLNESKIISFAQTYDDEIVIKKDFGLGGKQVVIMHSDNFEINKLSNKENYVIQPLIRQHEVLNCIFPKSVNTLRIVTSMNVSGKVSVKFSRLRFGTGESRVDNGSSGGLSCMINEDGRLNKFAYSQLGDNIGEYHPTTNFKFCDVKIPNYQAILNMCIKNHHRCPYGKVIGWDIAIDEESKPVLIEWNLDPLIWSTEALYGPFWRDDIKELSIMK